MTNKINSDSSGAKLRKLKCESALAALFVIICESLIIRNTDVGRVCVNQSNANRRLPFNASALLIALPRL